MRISTLTGSGLSERVEIYLGTARRVCYFGHWSFEAITGTSTDNKTQNKPCLCNFGAVNEWEAYNVRT